jgi:hypothetical protein
MCSVQKPEAPLVICHQVMVAPLPGEQQLQLIDVADEYLLNLNNEETPIY